MFESLKPSLKQTKNSHPVSSEDSRMTRKVRVIFQDPYATDSSSSEDEGESSRCVEKIQKRRAIIREINLPAPLALVAPALAQATSIQSETSSQDSNSRSGSNRKRVLAKTPDDNPKKAKSKKPVGIRQRKWGKWAAEIKHPITRKRIWIGTYSTLEEATAAYNAKKVEFAALVAAATASDKASNVTSSAAASQNHPNPAASGPEESDSALSHTSPSSVLDTSASPPTSKNNDTIVNDNIVDDSIAECFDINFEDMPILDFGFVDEVLVPGSVEQDLNFNLEFDDLLFANDFGTFLDGYCSIDDLNVYGIQGDEPSELPDYDFSTDDFLVADALFNIACP